MELVNRAVDEDETGDNAADFHRRSGRSAGFENIKKMIADQLHNAAEALGEKVADPDGPSGMAQYGNQVAAWLDQSAEYIRQFDYQQADIRIREHIRHSPGRSLLAAGAFGLIIGAILRRR